GLVAYSDLDGGEVISAGAIATRVFVVSVSYTYATAECDIGNIHFSAYSPKAPRTRNSGPRHQHSSCYCGNLWFYRAMGHLLHSGGHYFGNHRTDPGVGYSLEASEFPAPVCLTRIHSDNSV